MAKLLKGLIDATPNMDRGRPAVAKFYKYAKVELRPPTINELTPAVEEGKSIISFFKTGAWKQKSVKEFALDTVVAVEVLMWFFVGEIIGRRSLIGYKKVKGAYIVSH
nr:lethal (2) 06225 [Hymenolepis microstoma]